jgi:uncharacterized protein (DUF433 family)
MELEPEKIPLREDSHGVLRVAGTRVSLESVVEAFREGCTPEAIVERFPSVPLADVYLVLAFYLRHPIQVEAYLEQQRARADALQERVERRFPAHGLRARLLARQATAAG